MAFVTLAFTSACGFSPGSGLCEETTVEVESLVVGASQRPITLRARLTTEEDGHPVAGAHLIFFARTVPPSAPDQAFSHNTGTATTGPDGVAQLVVAAGADGLVAIRTDRLIGYDVAFRPLADVGGVHYCRSSARAPITVES